MKVLSKKRVQEYPLSLDINGLDLLDDDKFLTFCLRNKDNRFERSAEGRLIIMSPTGGETGWKNNRISFFIEKWNILKKSGLTFDSSTGFKLKNNAVRSPDCSWIAKARWEKLTREERKKFPPLCPDFVVELVSESDDINYQKGKMTEWIDNGCRLGWIIDPENEKAYVYRKNGSIDEIKSFDTKLSGEDVLPGFELDLKELG